MTFLAVLLVFIPLALTVGCMVWLIQARRLPVLRRMTLASGLVAGAVTATVLAITSLGKVGPWAVSPQAGWPWRIGLFTASAGLFAVIAGWAATCLFLGLRQTLRGRWGQADCPPAWELSLACCAVLGLIVVYAECALALGHLLKAG